MRVLAKPELDNAVILNEFVMIMENFGVMDQMEGEDSEDYIPDTEQSVSQSLSDLKAAAEEEENDDIEDETGEAEAKQKEDKKD